LPFQGFGIFLHGLPHLRAETTALIRRPKFSAQGVGSQAAEGGHYGVQARRRDGEAAG